MFKEYGLINFDGAFVGSEEEPRVVLYEAGPGIYSGYFGHDAAFKMPMLQKILFALSMQVKHVFILEMSPYSYITQHAKELAEKDPNRFTHARKFMSGTFNELVEHLESGLLTADNTIIVVERAGAEHKLEEPDIKAMLRQLGFVGVPVLDEQSAFRFIFDKVGFAHMLSANPEHTPKTWIFTQDNYTSMLNAVLASGLTRVMLKPTNGCLAEGTTILTIEELKRALRWILFDEEPTAGFSAYQRDKIDQLKALLSQPLQQPCCIIQEVMQPIPVVVEEQRFLSAFRIVVLFAFDKVTGELALSLIDGFNKLAQQPYCGEVSDATLISAHAAIDASKATLGNNVACISQFTREEMDAIAGQKRSSAMPRERKLMVQGVLTKLSGSFARFFTMRPVELMRDLEAKNLLALARYFEISAYDHVRFVEQELVEYLSEHPLARGAMFALCNVYYALQKCIVTNSLLYISEQHFIWLRQLLLSFDMTEEKFWHEAAGTSLEINTMLQSDNGFFAPLMQWASMIDFATLSMIYCRQYNEGLDALHRGAQVLARDTSADPAIPTSSVTSQASAIVVHQAAAKFRQASKLLNQRNYSSALALLRTVQQDYVNAQHYKQVLVVVVFSIASCLHDTGELQKAIQITGELEALLAEREIETLDLSLLQKKKAQCVATKKKLADLAKEYKAITRDYKAHPAKSTATELVKRMETLAKQYQALLPDAKQTLTCLTALANMANVTKQSDLAKAAYDQAINVATALYGVNSDKVLNLKEKRAALDDAKLNYKNMFV